MPVPTRIVLTDVFTEQLAPEASMSNLISASTLVDAFMGSPLVEEEDDDGVDYGTMLQPYYSIMQQKLAKLPRAPNAHRLEKALRADPEMRVESDVAKVVVALVDDMQIQFFKVPVSIK